jgi:hypothetical protein
MTGRLLRVALVVVVFAVPDPCQAGLMTARIWKVVGDEPYGWLSLHVAPAGDVNGDGFDDLLVGSPYLDHPENTEGRIFLYLGSASGLGESIAWTAETNQAAAYLGAIAAGDFNGDGYSDVLAGATGYVTSPTSQGAVFGWFGGPPGPGDPSGLGLDGTPQNADWTASSPPDSGYGFGSSVASAGDIDGDGYDDVIVGAPQFSSSLSFPEEGKVYVFHGSSSGPSTTADWTAESNQAFADFGFAVASAGDLNNDGYDDVVIGAPCYEDAVDPARCDGTAFVFMGSRQGLGTQAGTPASADWKAATDQLGSFFAESVAGVGDVNGDGYGDLLLGAGQDDAGALGNAGRAHLWHGGQSRHNNPSGLGANGTPANADWRAEGDEIGQFFGREVAPAGDVNGDGFADVLLGAHPWPHANSPQKVGGAWVWLGGPGGLGVTGSPANADWATYGELYGADYGWAASTAGDINGDGFDDVLVGSPRLNVNAMNQEGAAYAYLGTCGSTDTDGDGVAPAGDAGCAPGDFTDCNDADGTAWDVPGETANLTLSADKSTLEWEPPETGGAAAGMLYDTIRSGDPSDFGEASASCVESDGGADTSASDPDFPASGGAFFYLVRAQNSCPSGQGSLGQDSSGVERSGRDCP